MEALLFCKVCRTPKPASEYYAGVRSRCKECHKEAMRLNRLTNPAVQERERARAKRPDKAAKIRANARQWRKDNPAAYKAQTALGNALRDGKIEKEPCAICGSDENIHAHHRDYSRPLDVVWLCARCHHRLHAVFPELEGRNKAPGSMEEADA